MGERISGQLRLTRLINCFVLIFNLLEFFSRRLFLIKSIFMSYVYILHFDKPISPDHTTQHYVGFTHDIDKRIRQHRKGQGSRLCAVAKERAIKFILAELLIGGKDLEKAIKRQKNTKFFCPICSKLNHCSS